MSTSAIPAILDYLVATFTAAPTLGAATPPVTVIDGALLSSDHPMRSLVVGTNDLDGTFLPEAATSTQSWVGIGGQHRNEHVQILCMAEAWSGDEELGLSPLRAIAATIVSAVENITRADANVGGNALYTEPGVTNLVWRQGQTNKGTLVRVFFSFDCFARIGA